jgi:hypothetical protein
MENSPLALAPVETHVLTGTGVRQLGVAARPVACLPRIEILRGRDALLSRLELLNTLGERTGQTGAARWLLHQMGSPTERKKIPTLVLVGGSELTGAPDASVDEVHGAVIVYEFKVAGCGLKVFAGADTTGQQAVIAARHLRSQVAEAACAGLIAAGALAVMVTYEGLAVRHGALRRNRSTPRCETAMRSRSVPLFLPLKATLPETLASLGRHTRRNLRYYRRRLESDMGSEFVPRVAMNRDEFLAVNRASMNPVSDAVAGWRFDAFASLPEMLFAGVRARDGRWLSVVGGRRHRQITEIDWQMNVAGLPRLSLSTAMRSYLLQHEIQLGTETLMFNGGTPHSMRHSFVSVDVVDTIFLRQSPGARLVRVLAQWAAPRGNFLCQALCDRQMSWVEA